MAMSLLRREWKRFALLILFNPANAPARSSFIPKQLTDDTLVHRELAPLGFRFISIQVTVRNRMKSVKNIQKITKAMKLVAASKLRAVQARAENSRGLWQPFTALLGDTPSTL